MSKYLDNNGLSYFWGKLKTYFQEKLVSGTNIKTVNNESLLGSGNITIQGGSASGTSVPTADEVAEFDSSAKMNSTDMTAQEVSDFVDSISGRVANLVDYVVDEGTDGIWTYRKWNNGTTEAWGYVEGTTNSGGDWEYIAVAPSFFLLAHHMYVSATGWALSSASAGVKYALAYIVNNEWRIDTWLRQGNAGVTCGISYYIFGRWK